MRPVSITATALGGSTPVLPDFYQQPFDMGISLNLTGSINVTIQYTLDDVYNTPQSSWLWINHPTLQNISADTAGSIQFPVTGIRIYVNTIIGTPNCIGRFVQGISGN